MDILTWVWMFVLPFQTICQTVFVWNLSEHQMYFLRRCRVRIFQQLLLRLQFLLIGIMARNIQIPHHYHFGMSQATSSRSCNLYCVPLSLSLLPVTLYVQRGGHGLSHSFLTHRMTAGTLVQKGGGYCWYVFHLFLLNQLFLVRKMFLC